MTSTPFWKRVHQTVSGYSQNVTPDIVAEILKRSKEELLEGILIYKRYSKEGYTAWAKKADVSNTMKEFIYDLGQELDLDSALAHKVVCNYLMFEFYGKMKEFWHVTRIGTTVHLKESIFNFYMAERMFLIKTWRHIFEHVDKDCKFSKTYGEFLNGIKIEELQNSILKQLGNENILTQYQSSQYIVNWLCRDSREQTELLLLLILTISHHQLSVEQMVDLVELFVQNNFGAQPHLFEYQKYSEKTDLEELVYAELGCFIVVLESLWDNDSDFWQNQLIIDMDRILLSLQLNEAHTVVVLAWLVLKFVTTDGKSGNESTVFELVSQQPFVTLHKMLTSHMFNNCRVADIVAKAIHKVFEELSLVFNDRKMLYEKHGAMSLVTELVSRPELAEICLKARGGVDCLIEIACDAFPFDFFSFSGIMRSLLQSKTQKKEAIKWLCNVPSFLSDTTCAMARDYIIRLPKDQRIFPHTNLIVFPNGTIVKSYSICGKTLIQYRGMYSYFALLECYVGMLINNGVQQRKFDEDLVQKVIMGYGVVMEAIRSCTDMDLKVVGLERITEKIKNILIILDGPLLHFELVKLYFQVQNTMMEARCRNFFDSCPSFVWEVFFLKLRPEVIGRSPNQLLFSQPIFEDTVFMRLLKEEMYRDDHDLILTYIRILHNSIKVKYQKRYFQLSGTTYLLKFVFTQHTSWSFKNRTQLTEITLSCLTLFHHILQANIDDLNDTEKQVFELCYHAFIHDHTIVDTFLQLFLNDKYHLILMMERETNWTGGPALDELKCIRMKLALLLLLMKHNRTAGKCYFNERLPFIVKPVAFYFTNSYSPVIAELSCRFLEKLAQDQFVPMLALLELDHYQVQSLFLEKLGDPLEEDNVKLAVIDLINACVSNQDGMTAAFFNLKCFMYWDGVESEDTYVGNSVGQFIVDYLQNIKTSHEFFKNPLQLGVLRLLYNLWLNHKQNLIEDISKMEDFWPIMTDLFFCNYAQDVDAYTRILRIINLEIGANMDSVDTKLTQIIDKFVKDKDQLKKWMNFVLQSSKNHLELLKAWTECVVLAIQITPNSFEKDVKILLIDSCLDGINSPDPGLYDLNFVSTWIQVLLVLIKRWPLIENQPKDLVQKILCCMRCLNSYYKCLPTELKEIFLSAINLIVADLRQLFSADTKQLLTFLYTFGYIVDLEHECFVREVWAPLDDDEKTRRVKPWLIVILIGNDLLSLENLTEIAIWFSYRKILQRVMESVEPLLRHRCTFPFAKLATDFLVTYARSPLVGDFLNLDLFTFYCKIRPSSLVIGIPAAISKGIPVDLKEWWLIFIILIKLNLALLHQMGNHVLSICFAFITEHDLLLKDLISLTKYTVDRTALTLVCECIKLVYRLLILRPDWHLNEPNSYGHLMVGLKTTMNATMLSILGYKKIHFYKICVDRRGEQYLESLVSPSNELQVSVLNKLTEIIYWGSICLKQTKPNINMLFNNRLDSTHYPEHFDVLIDVDFSVPIFELPVDSKITYGTLLCLADYLCKIFNQLSPATDSLVCQLSVCLAKLDDYIKRKSLGKIFEHCTATYEKCTGFLVFTQKTDDLPNEKLSSFLHYDMSEFSGSIISQVNYNLVKNALEATMMFLAVDVFHTLRRLEGKALFSYKRELSSEIQFFYEFVRKRTSELCSTMATTPKSKNESDVTRYVMTKVNNGDVDEIADSNFVLAISQLLIQYCRLSN